MKLYLSSYRIPEIKSLEVLLGKALDETTVALIPNAKDYYSELAWNYKVNKYITYFQNIGTRARIVDLRDYNDPIALKNELSKYDLIWAMGGNAYRLRYEMKRSGFESCIRELLSDGIVYGGDSAGAIVAGSSLKGFEEADVPEFAPETIYEGLGLISFTIMPHVGNVVFEPSLEAARLLHKHSELIELTDIQAAVFDGNDYKVVEGESHRDAE